MPNDPLEREAERNANEVLRASGLDDGVTAGELSTGERPTVSSGERVLPELESGLRSGRPGSPLTPSVRRVMESHFGHDLSGVRIHTDPGAASAAKKLEARAFTRGTDIYLASDASPTDRGLVAHELTHVLQQNGAVGPTLPPGTIQRQPADTHHRDFSPSGMISRHTSWWGDLDERALAEELFLLAWQTEGHYGIVVRVIDALPSTDQDDVAFYFTAGAPDDALATFARTSSGREMMARLYEALAGGIAFGGERNQARRLQRFYAAGEARETGVERARELLDRPAAPTPGPVYGPPAPGQEPAQPTQDDLGRRIRLIEATLDSLRNRYRDHEGALAAIDTARSRLESVRSSVGSGTAPEAALRIPQAQALVSRVETALELLERFLAMATESGPGEDLGGQRTVIEMVRSKYFEAIEALLTPEAAQRFNAAEAAASRLPRALTELELAQLEGRPVSYTLLRGYVVELREWATWTRSQIDLLESKGAELQRAREQGASNVAELEAEVNRLASLIDVSIEGMRQLSRALNAWEFLQDNLNLMLEANVGLSRVFNRTTAIKQAATSGDLASAREQLRALENDPEVKKLYEDLPEYVRTSQFIINLGIVFVAALATAGVGSLMGGLLGTGAAAGGAGAAAGGATAGGGITTTGLLATAGTVTLEALTFTAVSRSLQTDVFGTEPGEEFWVDFLWNLGLFGALRTVSWGVKSGLIRLGKQGWIGVGRVAAAYPTLQTYGTVRFFFEQGRWPTADEFGRMAVENLIMLAGLTVGMTAIQRSLRALRSRPVEYFFRTYGERFRTLEAEQNQLMGEVVRLRNEGYAPDSPEVQAVRGRARELDAAFRRLVEEIRSDPKVDVDALREALKSLEAELVLEGSGQLVESTLGLSTTVGLEAAGVRGQYSYAWGRTQTIESHFREQGLSVERSFDFQTRLSTLTVRGPGIQALRFVERSLQTEYERLGQRFGLQPDVEGMLRESAVEPTLVEALLGRGINPDTVALVADGHGTPGIRLLDALTSRGVRTRVAVNLVQEAASMRNLPMVVELAESGAVSRLLGRGISGTDVVLHTDALGRPGIEVIDQLLQLRVETRPAVEAAEIAKRIDALDAVHRLLRSGRLENPLGLRNFLRSVEQEVKGGQRGKFEQLTEAAERAERASADPAREGRVALEKSLAPEGEADIVDHAAREAVQMKSLTTTDTGRAVEAVNEAARQLRGETGEVPPEGYSLIADIRIRNPNNSMYNLGREGLIEALQTSGEGVSSGSLRGVDQLRVTNGAGEHVLTPGDF